MRVRFFPPVSNGGQVLFTVVMGVGETLKLFSPFPSPSLSRPLHLPLSPSPSLSLSINRPLSSPHPLPSSSLPRSPFLSPSLPLSFLLTPSLPRSPSFHPSLSLSHYFSLPLSHSSFCAITLFHLPLSRSLFLSFSLGTTPVPPLLGQVPGLARHHASSAITGTRVGFSVQAAINVIPLYHIPSITSCCSQPFHMSIALIGSDILSHRRRSVGTPASKL